MLSLHSVLIAVVFVPYFTAMVTLGAYIYRTGHPRNDDPPDTGDGDRLPALLLAA